MGSPPTTHCKGRGVGVSKNKAGPSVGAHSPPGRGHSSGSTARPEQGPDLHPGQVLLHLGDGTPTSREGQQPAQLLLPTVRLVAPTRRSPRRARVSGSPWAADPRHGAAPAAKENSSSPFQRQGGLEGVLCAAHSPCCC